MKNRFPIGEMAKLHNTSIKTLRYYDEIRLLKPDYIDPNNGYRYYSTEQFEHLNTIHYLKKLGFSLKEIKQHLARIKVKINDDSIMKIKACVSSITKNPF